MRDLFGIEINAGCYIAIGMRAGNGGRLGAGIVLESKTDGVKYHGIDRFIWDGKMEKQSKPAWLHDSNKIVVLSNPPKKLVDLFSSVAP